MSPHPSRLTPHSSRREAGGATLRAILWAFLGAALAILLVADPFGISPVDGWLGLSRQGGTAGQTSASGTAGKEEHKQLWTCGMHQQVIQDHPGNCPICGMKLVPLRGQGGGEESAPQAAGKPKERKILFYRNPMDPTITSPVPRKDDMGMDYVPVYADQGEATANQAAVVTIDPAVQQNMNVVIQKVQRRDVTQQIRTVGYLDYDHEKIVSVTTKYPGFIEKTYVNYIGQPVKKGEPLFEIYAPELVQTEQELLSAKRYADNMADSGTEVARRAKSLLLAARERLGYWDITAAQIEDLEKTGKVFRTLKVVSPASGIVMTRMEGLEGMAARPGMELLKIADLSDLWLTVEVFSNQLPWVRIGSPAKINLTYFPGETFRGRIRYIEPEVSEKTRTIRLTLEIPNPARKLRVGMYSTVLFEPVIARKAITVPSEAVFRTGERNVVVVSLGDGKFAPRDLKLGPEGDGFVQVLEGLSDGDEVVTSAQFLIDSESNLKEAIQKMIDAKRREDKGAADAQ
ncbi:MAG: efflux RND transporter periplasmic adaptor subunit [Acidobacteria bacterium]|nr:efflux RND transporter periplasmic adaptor subunit [Acidobacteriota bacterium]